jgi:hypothetical protein
MRNSFHLPLLLEQKSVVVVATDEACGLRFALIQMGYRVI